MRAPTVKIPPRRPPRTPPREPSSPVGGAPILPIPIPLPDWMRLPTVDDLIDFLTGQDPFVDDMMDRAAQRAHERKLEELQRQYEARVFRSYRDEEVPERSPEEEKRIAEELRRQRELPPEPDDLPGGNVPLDVPVIPITNPLPRRAAPLPVTVPQPVPVAVPTAPAPARPRPGTAPARRAAPAPAPPPPLTRPAMVPIVEILSRIAQSRSSTRSSDPFGYASPAVPITSPAATGLTTATQLRPSRSLRDQCEDYCKQKRKRKRQCVRKERVWVAGHYRNKCRASVEI